MWNDDTRYTNPLRSDGVGKVTVFSWTVSQLPQWLRHERAIPESEHIQKPCQKGSLSSTIRTKSPCNGERRVSIMGFLQQRRRSELPARRLSNYGWFTFAVVDADRVKEFKAEVSGLWKAALRLFFLEGDSNFAKGVTLPSDTRSGFQVFFASLRFVVQDELAHREMLQCKGAAGSICCSQCSNVMNIDPDRIRDRRDVVHYALGLPAKFERHTDESIWKVIGF
jgi:hypothetical protein